MSSGTNLICLHFFSWNPKSASNRVETCIRQTVIPSRAVRSPECSTFSVCAVPSLYRDAGEYCLLKLLSETSRYSKAAGSSEKMAKTSMIRRTSLLPADGWELRSLSRYRWRVQVGLVLGTLMVMGLRFCIVIHAWLRFASSICELYHGLMIADCWAIAIHHQTRTTW